MLGLRSRESSGTEALGSQVLCTRADSLGPGPPYRGPAVTIPDGPVSTPVGSLQALVDRREPHDQRQGHKRHRANLPILDIPQQCKHPGIAVNGPAGPMSPSRVLGLWSHGSAPVSLFKYLKLQKLLAISGIQSNNSPHT